MLEIATEALAAFSVSSAVLLAGENGARAVGRFLCFLCNLGSGYGDGLPGSGSGLAGPAAGGPDEEEEEPDDCAGQRRGVQMAEGFVNTKTSQINSDKLQINELAAPMQELLDRMSSLADEAQAEVLWYLLDQLLDKFKDVLTSRIPVGGTGLNLDDILGFGGDITGDMSGETFGEGADAGIGDVADFFQDLSNYYTLVAGSWEDLGKMADAEGMPAIKAYVDAMMQLRKLTDRGHELVNAIRNKEMELEDLQRKLDEARAELAACMASSGAAA
jgi:hypothetical protein